MDDFDSSYISLLEQTNEGTIHQRCINSLLIEVYKYLNGFSPDIMNEIFILRENRYNLRNFHLFETDNPQTVRFGLDSIAYRASQLWQQLPLSIRESRSLALFKEKIKTWQCTSCPCRSCQLFVANVGYI